jgi:excisionase family DNA binding protein
VAREANRHQVGDDGPPSHYLTVRCAAKQLGMSRKALRSLIAGGQMPVYRHNGRPLVDLFTAQLAMRRMRQSPFAALSLSTVRGGRFQID